MKSAPLCNSTNTFSQPSRSLLIDKYSCGIEYEPFYCLWTKWALLKLAWWILNMLLWPILLLLSINIDWDFPKRYVLLFQLNWLRNGSCLKFEILTLFNKLAFFLHFQLWPATISKPVELGKSYTCLWKAPINVDWKQKKN